MSGPHESNTKKHKMFDDNKVDQRLQLEVLQIMRLKIWYQFASETQKQINIISSMSRNFG